MMHMKNYTVLAAVLCMQSTLFGFDKKTAAGSAATAGLLLLGAYEQHQSSKANAAIFWAEKAVVQAKAAYEADTENEELALAYKKQVQRLTRLKQMRSRHNTYSKSVLALALGAAVITYLCQEPEAPISRSVQGKNEQAQPTITPQPQPTAASGKKKKRKKK